LRAGTMRGILSDAGLTIEDAQISPELRGCVTDGNTIDEAWRGQHDDRDSREKRH
jgi:hypothetical protein